MKIKICGLKREEDILYVNEIKPDYIGFVFAGEKRKIDEYQAKNLKKLLDPSIISVGVFVNEDVNFISQLFLEGVIDLIQLHGDENINYIGKLNNLLLNKNKSAKLIKAIRVKDNKSLLNIEHFPVDYFLLDAFKEDEFGGSGIKFDHSLISNLSKPYFLAGGISSSNIYEILSNLKKKNINLPFAIDVSSSVETNGLKDKEKIEEIVRITRKFK